MYEHDTLQMIEPPMTDTSAASADRRPVDPPPVVELKIFEGEAKTDVTFSHNANFFLYTTLESARTIAPGRGNATPAPYPVLTGMPVAGMAYLDRPSPAGYFIFPDLSVRHEGKYRLSFNLFEELKEAKDADTEPALSNPEHPNNKLLRSSPMAPHSHVHFRLEVKSEPFVVYSAKKFPGLAESTALSRVVAEQGCRVRIRRDVRMRRRENKPSKDYDDFDDEGVGYSRGERYATPDSYAQQAAADRARSVSNASVDHNTPFASIERRASSHEASYYGQPAYPQQSVTPIPQAPTNNYASHLSFGSAVPQYQAPSIPSGAGVPQSGPSYASNGSNYQCQPAPPALHSRQMSNGSNYAYPNAPQYQQPQFPAPPSYVENTEYKPTDYRRSIPSQPNSYVPREGVPYPAIDTRLVSGTQAYYAPPPAADLRSSTPTNTHQLPPIKSLQPTPVEKYDQPPAVVSSPPQSSYDMSSSGYPSYAQSAQPPSSASDRTGKRSYGKVFDSGSDQSLYGGARPAIVGQDILQIACDEEGLVDPADSIDLGMLSYRRADGSKSLKKVPPIA